MNLTEFNRLLTTVEAAEKINVSRRVILGALAKGKLKGLRRGWTWLIDPIELELFHQRRKR